MDRRRRDLLATKGGPVVTVLLTGAFIAFYCCVFFEEADPSNAFDGLKVSGSACALATVLLASVCHHVDPGTPEPDPRDLGPAEGREEDRVRTRTLADGQTWKQKFCRECQLWRPHRCGHCHWCRRCVLRLDHHCLFVGTCIGERNMRFFAAFLLCAGAAFLHGLVATTRCLRSSTCWSTHERLDRWVGPRISPYVHKLYVIDGVMCLAMGSCILTTTGVVYVVTMLGDVDLHSCRSLRGAFAELRKLRQCAGLRTFLCGPVARKLPVRRAAAALP